MAGTCRSNSKNPANPAYHRSTTGPEILRDFAGKRLDVFVSGVGTGGTITGAGQMLRLARPDIKIVVTEPEGAALLSGNEWKPHMIQGWTPDFIPPVLDRKVYDEIVTVTDVEARDAAPRAGPEGRDFLRRRRPAERSRRREGGEEVTRGDGAARHAAGHRRASTCRRSCLRE
jgi:cysteine synthase